MTKKLIIATIIIILSVIGGVYYHNYIKNKEHQRQISKFESEYYEINSQSPYELNKTLLESVGNINTNDEVGMYIVKSKLNMIEEGYFFKTSYEENLKLTIDMLEYKLNNIKRNQLTLDDVRKVVDDIRTKPNDRLNSLIIKTFDKSIEYYVEYQK